MYIVVTRICVVVTLRCVVVTLILRAGGAYMLTGDAYMAVCVYMLSCVFIWRSVFIQNLRRFFPQQYVLKLIKPNSTPEGMTFTFGPARLTSWIGGGGFHGQGPAPTRQRDAGFA